MEFRKIDDRKFQCLLDEEDLEDNNISLDDFFKNDTEKIHNLLDVVMEEAQKSIGVTLSGEIMSLQLAPQPDRSILLTVSSGKDDLSNMLRKAGESISKAFSKPEKSNVIKNGDDRVKNAPFETFGDSLDKFEISEDEEKELKKSREEKKSSNILKAGVGVFRLKSFDDFEDMCAQSGRTWGINNALYQDEKSGEYYLVLEKGRCAQEKYRGLLNLLMEYSEFDSSREERTAYIKEHYRTVISSNAINTVKKYL